MRTWYWTPTLDHVSISSKRRLDWEDPTQSCYGVASQGSPFDLPVCSRMSGNRDKVFGHNCFVIRFSARSESGLEKVLTSSIGASI